MIPKECLPSATVDDHAKIATQRCVEICLMSVRIVNIQACFKNVTFMFATPWNWCAASRDGRMDKPMAIFASLGMSCPLQTAFNNNCSIDTLMTTATPTYRAIVALHGCNRTPNRSGQVPACVVFCCLSLRGLQGGDRRPGRHGNLLSDEQTGGPPLLSQHQRALFACT